MKIIINADDYGMNQMITEAIDEAMQKQLVSETTLCANGDYVEKAVSLAKMHGYVERIGIHVNLTEGFPLTEGIKKNDKFCDGEKFHGKIPRRESLTPVEISAVIDEIHAQIQMLQGLGLDVSHLDSHHHVHMQNNLIAPFAAAIKSTHVMYVRNYRNIKHGVSFNGRIKDKIKKIKFESAFRNYKYTNLFGSMEEAMYLNSGSLSKETIIEIMTHPQYDSNGLLIDRVDFKREQIGGGLIESANDLKRKFRVESFLSIKEAGV